jgi:MoaA/NifB/PqqE/SkfB family radical SAM enzyme
MFLHLEITSRCTLKCHACPRTIHFGKYKITDLPLAAIQNLTTFAAGYSKVLLCGDHGDPIYHPRFHEIILELIKIFPNTPIGITTNGSGRPISWWKHTANLLRPIDQVCFSIDGAGSSSATYRVNSNWDSIQDGINTLRINGKCELIWKWILFNYNVKDLTAGKALAKKLGFKYFMINRSNRHFADSDTFKTEITIDEVRRILTNEGISEM